MVTEGLVLSSIGGAVGYVVGQWVTWAYVSRLDVGADLPLRFDATFDMRGFLFSLAAAVAPGVGVGLWGTLSGSLMPIALKRLGFDPATSSAPVVATLVDVTGLVIYFSVALVVLRGTLL